MFMGTVGVTAAASETPDQISVAQPAGCLCYNSRVIFGKGKGKSNLPRTARTVRAGQADCGQHARSLRMPRRELSWRLQDERLIHLRAAPAVRFQLSAGHWVG
jgi:hypothetical protein